MQHITRFWKNINTSIVKAKKALIDDSKRRNSNDHKNKKIIFNLISNQRKNTPILTGVEIDNFGYQFSKSLLKTKIEYPILVRML